MIQKKICLLGAFGVGKTSLVSRFVHSIFSDKYLTTVGVKVSKKSVLVEADRVDLVIWDLYGEDEFQKLNPSFLRGSSGYVLVADGTRPATLDTAVGLQRLAEATVGKAPFMLAINKVDLPQWQVTDDRIADFERDRWPILRTSAKTGDGVEEAFTGLAQAMQRV
jgi:small GTP-binding protein